MFLSRAYGATGFYVFDVDKSDRSIWRPPETRWTVEKEDIPWIKEALQIIEDPEILLQKAV